LSGFGQGKEFDGVDEHEGVVFADGENDAQGANDDAAEFHPQGRQAIKWLTNLGRIGPQALVNGPGSPENVRAAPLLLSLCLMSVDSQNR
jgi:hypothetical protein